MSKEKKLNNRGELDLIAVFIDGDNISHKYIPVILQEIRNYGRIIINNIYCDWSSLEYSKLKLASIENGITTIQCDKIVGKNSTDIKLMVDIMRTLYEINHISLYYIITSDSDFRHVIPQIKMRNKKVHCIGSFNSNKSIQSICDLFTKIEVLIDYNNSYVSSSDEHILLGQEVSFDNNKDSDKKKKLSYDKPVGNEIILEIKNAIDNHEKLNLGALKTLLERKYTFDFREYNCNSMKSFIDKNSSLLNCQLLGNQYVSKKKNIKYI